MVNPPPATEVRALAIESLTVPQGQFLSVMGPSGSGKSTLLNLLGALDVPTSGSIIIEGRDISKLTDAELSRFRRERLGFVFQFFNLLPSLTALEPYKRGGSDVSSRSPPGGICMVLAASTRAALFGGQ